MTGDDLILFKEISEEKTLIRGERPANGRLDFGCRVFGISASCFFHVING